MKSQILKFRGMSHSLQFSQLGISINIYFIGSSLAILRDLRGKNSRGVSLKVRAFSTISSIDSTLFHPYFITGFADAESSFIISITKNSQLKIG